MCLKLQACSTDLTDSMLKIVDFVFLPRGKCKCLITLLTLRSPRTRPSHRAAASRKPRGWPWRLAVDAAPRAVRRDGRRASPKQPRHAQAVSEAVARRRRRRGRAARSEGSASLRRPGRCRAVPAVAAPLARGEARRRAVPAIAAPRGAREARRRALPAVVPASARGKGVAASRRRAARARGRPLPRRKE